MAEYPAMPLFTDAFIGDTLHLNSAQVGAYMLMLMTAWRSPDCSLPNDDVYLARITRMDKRTWLNNKKVLLEFWQVTEDAKLFQKRLGDERIYVEEKRNNNSKAGKASALKRKNRGSTSVQKNANKNPTPTPTPTPIFGIDKSIPHNVDRKLWIAFMEVRSKKKAACTENALDLLVKTLEKIIAEGGNPNEAIENSIMNGWTGLFPAKGGKVTKQKHSNFEEQDYGAGTEGFGS